MPSAQQLRAQRLAEDFASAEADAFTDVEGGWDPEGGLDDDDTVSEASSLGRRGFVGTSRTRRPAHRRLTCLMRASGTGVGSNYA